MFLQLKENCEISESGLNKLFAVLDAVSLYRTKRFSVLPEGKQNDAQIIDKILLKADANKTKRASLFVVDMEPFIKQYIDAYGPPAAEGLARDAFSAICTSLSSGGLLFTLDSEKALAVLLSRTEHDPQLFAGQMQTVFARIALNQNQYKPHFGSFEKLNFDDADAKQKLRLFLDKIRD